MYRGDDIYLFDYWPLDNLNTIGAGAKYERNKFEVALQAGLNRLDDLYQYETLATPPRGLGPATQSVVLDRPRFVSSLKLQQRFGDFPGFKVALYGELHLLPAGTETDATTMLKTALPSDTGWVVGAQLGGWLRPYVFANLWFRAAGGLAAYGELTVPTGLDPDALGRQARASSSARSRSTGSRAGSASWAAPTCAASPTRRRRRSTRNSYTEGIVAVRPHIYWNEYFHTAVELSYQARKADGVDFVANRVLVAAGVPLLGAAAGGADGARHLLAPADLSHLHGLGDERRRAQALYDPSDYRYGQNIVHYIGTGVEWWFNSSYR